MNENPPTPTTNRVGSTDSERVVDMTAHDRIVGTTVYPVDDEVRVEVTTEQADGTLAVSTFQLFKTRSCDTVIPKYTIDPTFRLIVGAALAENGYELALE